MKNTMNKSEIAKYHKMLEQEIPLENISKYFNVSLDTLDKLSPEAFHLFKKKQKSEKNKLEKQSAKIPIQAE